MMNIINGGAHADNSVDMQEFMILPWGQDSFAESLRCGVEIFHTLKSVLKKRGLSTAVGDEGGFAPDLPSNEAAVEVILEAVEQSGYRIGQDVSLGLDVASSEFYRDGRYHLESENKSFEPEAFAEYLADWVRQYPIISIEDGMAEDDWDGWAVLTRLVGERCQLVGDDLFVTNTEIFRRGIDLGIANSILIKLNQIGTLTETLEAIAMADAGRFQRGDLPPLRRDRGHHHCRSGGRHHGHPDQDGLAVPFGPGRQVQPAVADRGSAGRGWPVCRARCVYEHTQLELIRGHARPARHSAPGPGGAAVEDVVRRRRLPGRPAPGATRGANRPWKMKRWRSEIASCRRKWKTSGRAWRPSRNGPAASWV